MVHDVEKNNPPREAQRRPGAVQIARVVGVPVYVNLSWILVALLIAYVFRPVVDEQVPGLGVWSFVAALGFAVLLYASVLVHEIAHVLVARKFDLPVRAITLQFLGGLSEIESEPQTPWREFAVAVVGPLTSLGISGLAALGHTAVSGPALLELALFQLAWANLLVGLFNLLPGLPLDGGRLLRAGVWAVTKQPHLGTAVAGWAGRVVAAVVLLLPWTVLARTGGSPSLLYIVWSVFLAMFMWAGSSQALMSAKIRRKLPAIHARTLARRGVPVASELPLSEAVRRAQEAHAGSLVVVGSDGRPTGLVSEAAVLATPEHRRPWISVGDVARRIEPGLVLDVRLTGEALVRAMGGTPATEYLLVEPDGRVFGVLATADVDGALART
ncbi:site-2 protease family protein [Actinopolymorpha rutila]|uniref:Zinc metalloprotease n=1 Tax=Actinopolymorpha rutila TaxID=446787 RepID=A0A852ZNI6_9ACTN|nr:site-2 protease family protein [Actinopolymorpha rutila]NYH90026.1 Zn-dependent protease/CBS domain-containing protein [Actinopolymorpha rutila]